MLPAWALWWDQGLENKREMPRDIVKLGVHETREACEERAAARRQWQEDLSQQEVKRFDWNSKPRPTYMLRRTNFTCIRA